MSVPLISFSMNGKNVPVVPPTPEQAAENARQVVKGLQTMLPCGCNGKQCPYEKRYDKAVDLYDRFDEGDPKICEKYDYEPDELIEMLHDAQCELEEHLASKE